MKRGGKKVFNAGTNARAELLNGTSERTGGSPRLHLRTLVRTPATPERTGGSPRLRLRTLVRTPASPLSGRAEAPGYALRTLVRTPAAP